MQNRSYLREVALQDIRQTLRPTNTKETHLEILVEVPKRLWLNLDTLQPLTLHLRRRLDSIHDLEFHKREERPGSDPRVRPERHEKVREAVNSDREVRDRVRLPPLIELDAVPADDLERELEGRVVS